MNALQIMVHLPLINLALPVNAYKVSKFLANVASFDIIPTQWFYYSFLEFKNRNEMPSRYDLLGFDSFNFLLNSGTMFLSFFSWIFMAIIYKAVKKSWGTG